MEAWRLPAKQLVVGSIPTDYVTHQGIFQIFVDNSRPFVLARSEVTQVNAEDVTWTHSVADFGANESRFVECHVAGEDIVNETTSG